MPFFWLSNTSQLPSQLLTRLPPGTLSNWSSRRLGAAHDSRQRRKWALCSMGTMPGWSSRPILHGTNNPLVNAEKTLVEHLENHNFNSGKLSWLYIIYIHIYDYICIYISWDLKGFDGIWWLYPPSSNLILCLYGQSFIMIYKWVYTWFINGDLMGF